MTTPDDIRNESIAKIDLMNRTFQYLTALYSLELTIRELLAIPLPKLIADIRTKYSRPDAIIADINTGLRPHGLKLGESPQLLAQPTAAYPGMSRRSSARMFLWFSRYKHIRNDAWALKDMSRTFASFESEVVRQIDIPRLQLKIEKQRWLRLDGSIDPMTIWPLTTYGDVLAAYFSPA